MKVRDWYKENKQYFSLSEINFIFRNIGIHSSIFLGNCDKKLNIVQIDKLKEVKSSCHEGFPLAFVLGNEDFFGWNFRLNSKTLIPRPETEILVEKAAEIIKNKNLKVILDLCCGCGNIGISLDKLFFGKIKVYLSDLSREALLMAKKNSLNLASKVCLVKSDLFSAFKYNSFDLIISNPPYVETKNIRGRLLYEPREALDGGKNGLFFIKKIIEQAHYYLKNGGYLIIEFGYRQKARVKEVIQENKQYKINEWIKDYAGIWRGVVLENG